MKDPWLLARAEDEIRVRLANGAGAIAPAALLEAWLRFEQTGSFDCRNRHAAREIRGFVDAARPHYRKRDWQKAKKRVRTVLIERVRA